MTDQESIDILNSLIPPLKSSSLVNQSSEEKTPTATKCPVVNGHDNGHTGVVVNGEKKEPVIILKHIFFIVYLYPSLKQ